MKKILKSLILVSLVFILTGCGKSNLKEITIKEYRDLIKNEETFAVEIMRTTCSHCTEFKPKLEQIAKDYDIEINYINLSNENKDEADSFYDELSISGTPTVIFYNKGKEETISSRIVGNRPIDYVISKFKINGFIKED